MRFKINLLNGFGNFFIYTEGFYVFEYFHHYFRILGFQSCTGHCKELSTVTGIVFNV